MIASLPVLLEGLRSVLKTSFKGSSQPGFEWKSKEEGERKRIKLQKREGDGSNV
jgi:hypothetical protein